MATSNVPASAAGTYRLGDLEVRRVGFGAMRLSARGRAFDDSAPIADREQSIRVLRRALELGVNHVDTAAFYFSSRRSANELINAALSPYPEDLVIVTKVGPSRDASGQWQPGARPDQLRGQVEENLRQLGRDHLDVVNLRRQGDTASVTELFGALAQLRDEGLIRHLGISGVDVGHLDEAQRVAPVVCVQNAYGAFRRDDDELRRVCAERSIAFVPFFSIAGNGRHLGPAVDDPATLRAIADAHGTSSAQVLLAWTLRQGPNVLVIPGTGDLEHLEQNVAAGALELSAAELHDLDALGAAS